MIKASLLLSIFLTSVYTIHFYDIDGGDQHFGSYSGKKILIVNIATGSGWVTQLSQLQQLYQQYHDSLEIVAFPSNSFGNEPRTNTQIKQFCQNSYGVTFRLASKTTVTGSGKEAVYDWLTSQSQNGVTNSSVVGDFQKFLLDKNGGLIGVFAPSVSPLDSTLVNVIAEN